MRRRILLSIVALTVLAVISLAVPLGFVLANLYREEEIVHLQRVAAEVAEQVSVDYPQTHAPGRFRNTREGARVALYDASGALIAGVGPRRADNVVAGAETGDLRDGEDQGRLIVASPLVRGEHVVGVIRVEKSLRVVHRRTRDGVLVMVAIGAGAVGLSALIGVYQSRRLARPVSQLAGAAERLGDGDFTVRSERSGIPEVDAVSAALEATAARLGQVLERERSFSADASHQLRTPLTGLRLSLEAARLDPRRDSADVLDEALGEVDRLERTIDDLLTLAREAPSERPVFNVEACVATVENDWLGRFARSGRTLRTKVDRGLPVVRASDRAIRQILDVLVDNALTHGAGDVVLNARPAASGVAIEVSDEGPGITGNPQRVFVRNADRSDNHGIGLGLARALAEGEGAALGVERASPGAMFLLFIPSSEDDSEA